MFLEKRMAEHPLAHTDRRPSHLLRFSKSQLCTNWKPDNPTSCHATCRYANRHRNLQPLVSF